MLTAVWALVVATSLQTPPATPATDPWPDGKPFRRLVQNLRDDATALVAADTLLILGGGGAATAASHAADDDLRDWVRDAGPSSSWDVFDTLGDGWVQAGAAVGTYVAGHLTGRPQVIHVGSDLVRAQALNGLITVGLKAATSRTRPSGGDRAFPSGHTSAAFASATVLEQHYGWRVGAPAYAVSSLVGWSRIRGNDHWLSDVVMGATIGVVVGRAVTDGHRERAWRVVPVRLPGGVAVMVTRTGW